MTSSNRRPEIRVNPLSVLAFALGLTALVVPPVGVLAVPTAKSARDQIAASPHTEAGVGLAKAGLILGWAAPAVILLYVTAIVATALVT